MQGCIYFCLTPLPPRAKIWPNFQVGEKCIFFPQLVKIIHIFSPIDLKYTKLQKKA